jgi:hypothetical protein
MREERIKGRNIKRKKEKETSVLDHHVYVVAD